MIKYTLLILLFLVNFHSFGRELPDFDKFWSILIKLESNNNPKAIGDGGKAIGIAQIHKNYFLDAQKGNDFLQKHSYSNCFQENISKQVVMAYILRYSKSNNWEEWAKLHNGGAGWKKKTGAAKKNLDIYWSKFKKIAKM